MNRLKTSERQVPLDFMVLMSVIFALCLSAVISSVTGVIA